MNARPRRDWMLYGFLALLLAACRAVGSIVLPIYDDAFITLRYARNLATGHGFVYHPGEWVLGVTSPLFGLVCAGEHALGLPMPGTVVVLNVLLDVAVLWLTIAAMPRERRAAGAIAFTCLFALSPIMTRVCVGGMEMDLHLAASLSAILLFERGRRVPAVLLAAVACFLRPEGVWLLGLLLFLTARRAGVGTAVRAAAGAAAVLAPPLLVLQWLYGSPLPQSLRAKAAREFARPDVWTAVWRMLIAPDVLTPILLVLALWGAWRAARWPGHGPQRLAGVWAVGYVLAFALARPQIWSWYGEPVYYGVVLFAALGVEDLVPRIAGAMVRPRAPIPARRLAACAALPLLVWIGVWRVAGPSRVTRNVFRPLAAWCRTHDARHASFMAADIGALGYFSNARIYDRVGLVWPEGALYRTNSEVIARYRPDYLFLNATQEARELITGSPWGREYRALVRFSKSGARALDLTDSPPANVWVQDYVLYGRVGGPER